MWFKAYHEFGHEGSIDRSNYRAEIEPDRCKGCGLCAKRCPMEAIQLVESEQATNKLGKVAVLETEKCIGCGVCAYKCPTQSIQLLKRDEEETVPPEDQRQFGMRWAEEMMLAHRGKSEI